MTVRMKDIAERIGVSITTVSHVLNRSRPVTPETRRRVLEVVRELNYFRDAHARRLARGNSDFFGLVISDIQNPFFPEIIKGFETAAVRRGFDLLLSMTNYDPKRTRAVLGKMIENKVRGVAVMTSHAAPEIAEELTNHQVPVVFLDHGPVRAYRSKIRLDYSQGVGQAVRYLFELGHRRFAFVSGPAHRPSSLTYREILTGALERLDLRCSLVCEGNLKFDGGVIAARNLLAGGELPTAVFCHNDLTALGVLSAFQQAGVRVPEQVSIVGSDDIYFAALTHPPLTTINLGRERIGELAFDALEKILRSKRRAGAEFVLGTELVVRESTGPAPRSPLKEHGKKRSQ